MVAGSALVPRRAGNHESLAITCLQGGRLDLEMYRAAGGGWFIDMPEEEQAIFVEQFLQLPIALEVQTDAGLIGLLHADSPFNDWSALRDSLLFDDDAGVREVCQWSRQRLKEGNSEIVAGYAPCWWGIRRCCGPSSWATSGTWTPVAGPVAISA